MSGVAMMTLILALAFMIGAMGTEERRIPFLRNLLVLTALTLLLSAALFMMVGRMQEMFG